MPAFCDSWFCGGAGSRGARGVLGRASRRGCRASWQVPGGPRSRRPPANPFPRPSPPPRLPLQADYFSCVGTVVYLRKENCMYQACPSQDCNKKVIDEHNGLFRCEKCDREFPNFKYRMILSVSPGLRRPLPGGPFSATGQPGPGGGERAVVEKGSGLGSSQGSRVVSSAQP